MKLEVENLTVRSTVEPAQTLHEHYPFIDRINALGLLTDPKTSPDFALLIERFPPEDQRKFQIIMILESCAVKSREGAAASGQKQKTKLLRLALIRMALDDRNPTFPEVLRRICEKEKMIYKNQRRWIAHKDGVKGIEDAAARLRTLLAKSTT